jgi:hypothetical protein
LLVHPIIMGKGKSFFLPGMDSGALQLTHSQTLDKGVVLLCYQTI